MFETRTNAGLWGGQVLGVEQGCAYLFVAMLQCASTTPFWRAIMQLLRASVHDMSLPTGERVKYLRLAYRAGRTNIGQSVLASRFPPEFVADDCQRLKAIKNDLCV